MGMQTLLLITVVLAFIIVFWVGYTVGVREGAIRMHGITIEIIRNIKETEDDTTKT